MDFEGLEDVVAYEGKQLVISLDGPITTNDNALELCEHFIDDGARFYDALSRYDEFVSNSHRNHKLRIGGRFQLILPFLRANRVSDAKMHEFSRSHIKMIHGAAKTVRFAQELMVSFVVSHSYEHHVSEACDLISFPYENAYCTKLSMNAVLMDDWEANLLKNYAKEIVSLPLIEIPRGAKGPVDLSARDQTTVNRLDDIFTKEISDLNAFRLVTDTHAIGAEEKAASLLDICKKTGVGLEDTIYIGNNASDAQALQLVRRGGGLSIAFNGSAEAIREAEVKMTSDNSVVTSVITEAFYKSGRDAVLSLVDDWNIQHIQSSGFVHDYLIKELSRVFPEGLPSVERVTMRQIGRRIEGGVASRQDGKGTGYSLDS
jgi:energy-converting hydrogenase A subunit R